MTDADGNFDIIFKAIPDNTAAKENMPIFTYEIEADITDLNGETRSAETQIKVGYHTLDVAVHISERIDTNQKKHHVDLKTNNLNGEFVPSKGIIRIYKLVAPKNVLRERPWETPDYQTFSKKQYETNFPNEPYIKEETDSKHWKKGTLVFQEDFDTEQSKEIILTKIKKWELGK